MQRCETGYARTAVREPVSLTLHNVVVAARRSQLAARARSAAASARNPLRSLRALMRAALPRRAAAARAVLVHTRAPDGGVAHAAVYVRMQLCFRQRAAQRQPRLHLLLRHVARAVLARRQQRWRRHPTI